MRKYHTAVEWMERERTSCRTGGAALQLPMYTPATTNRNDIDDINPPPQSPRNVHVNCSYCTRKRPYQVYRTS